MCKLREKYAKRIMNYIFLIIMLVVTSFFTFLLIDDFDVKIILAWGLAILIIILGMGVAQAGMDILDNHLILVSPIISLFIILIILSIIDDPMWITMIIVGVIPTFIIALLYVCIYVGVYKFMEHRDYFIIVTKDKEARVALKSIRKNKVDDSLLIETINDYGVGSQEENINKIIEAYKVLGYDYALKEKIESVCSSIREDKEKLKVSTVDLEIRKELLDNIKI